MATQRIDELNNMVTKTDKRRSLPFEQFFGEMDLTDEQKENRILLAEKLKDVLLYWFALIGVYASYEIVVSQYVIDDILVRYKGNFEAYIGTSEYINTYIDNVFSDVLNSTIENADDPYYTSDDRATFIAENDSNYGWNYEESEEAIKQGKTMKQWITMRDKRVRHTHSMVDGKTIKIKQAFKVGNSEMMYPMDTSLGAEDKEIVNCRCTIEYF